MTLNGKEKIKNVIKMKQKPPPSGSRATPSAILILGSQRLAGKA